MKTAFKTIGGILLGLIIVGSLARGIGKSISKNVPNNSLKEAIARANSSCPIEVGGGTGYVSAIKLEDNNVTYYVHFNERNNPMLTEKNQENLKEFFILTLLCMNGQEYGQGDFFVSKLIDEGCGLKVVYTDSSGKNFESVTSVDELKSMKDKFHQNPQETLYQALEMEIEVERASLPLKIEEGMYITNYSLDGENIVITINMDENLYSLNEVKNQKEGLKQSILQEGIEDPEMKGLFDLCKVSNTGLIYRMTGSYSKKNCDVLITSDEIREAVPVASYVSIN